MIRSRYECPTMPYLLGHASTCPKGTRRQWGGPQRILEKVTLNHLHKQGKYRRCCQLKYILNVIRFENGKAGDLKFLNALLLLLFFYLLD